METQAPTRPLRMRAFRVSAELDDHLQAVASQRGVTITELIKQALRRHLPPGLAPDDVG